MPEIYIPAEDYAYMKAGIKKAGYKEIGFLGVVESNEAGGIVRHLRILKQEVSSGSVDFTDEAHAEYLEWLYTPEEQGGAGWTASSYGLYSAHSHGNMGTFWSNTDEECIDKLGLSVPYVFSSVFNTKGEAKHRLDIFQGVTDICPLLASHGRIMYDKGDLIVFQHPDAAPVTTKIAEIEDGYKEQIKALEKERDESLKDLKTELKDKTEGVYAAVEERMKDDYKEYVKETYSWTGGKNKGGGSKSNPTQASRSLPSGASSGSDKKGSGSGNVGAVTGSESDPTDGGTNVLNSTWVAAFDTSYKVVVECTLADCIADMDLVPLKPIDDEILKSCNEAQVQMLAARPSTDQLKEEFPEIGKMLPIGYDLYTSLPPGGGI